MSVATRVRTYATVLALAGASVIWFTATGRKDPCSDSEHLVLSVKWQPGVLSIQRPVNIETTVDGVPIIKRERHVSPFNETMTACHDAEVILTAQTVHTAVHLLDCIILRNGNTSRKGYDVINEPGTVRCVS